MAKLTDEIVTAVAAAFSGIWISTYETEDAIKAIADACKAQKWGLFYWDPVQGLRRPGDEVTKHTPPDIHAALTSLEQEAGENKTTLLVMRNAVSFFSDSAGRVGDPTILQHLQSVIEFGAGHGICVVLLSYDHIAIPAELEKMVYAIDHNLPDVDERWELLNAIDGAQELPARNSDEARVLLDASAGLSRLEAIGAFSMSIVKHGGRIKPAVLWNLKAKMIAKTGLLEMLTRQQLEAEDTLVGFKSLGGLNVLKAFCLQMFQSKTRSKTLRPLGITLVGPAGLGKTAFASSLGDEIGWPTVRLDVGKLMGGLIGATEANTRRAFKTIDALSPCVLLIDEAEKAFAGASGEHDSGVGSRLLGGLLTWLNDHTSEAFPIFTSNDISRLPPELFRAERIDGIFFLDIPGREQKDIVWDIYTKHYATMGLRPEQMAARPNDENWTPAEIKSCCRQAALRDISLVEAAKCVVPVYKTNQEKIALLRRWATGRCLSADYEGMYDENGEKKLVTEIDAARHKRRVTRGIQATNK